MKRSPGNKPRPEPAAPRRSPPDGTPPVPDHYEPLGWGNYRTPPCRPSY